MRRATLWGWRPRRTKAKESAQVNNLEAAVLMWTTRNNEAEKINAKIRKKIDKLRRRKTIQDKTFQEMKVFSCKQKMV